MNRIGLSTPWIIVPNAMQILSAWNRIQPDEGGGVLFCLVIESIQSNVVD